VVFRLNAGEIVALLTVSFESIALEESGAATLTE